MEDKQGMLLLPCGSPSAASEEVVEDKVHEIRQQKESILLV